MGNEWMRFHLLDHELFQILLVLYRRLLVRIALHLLLHGSLRLFAQGVVQQYLILSLVKQNNTC